MLPSTLQETLSRQTSPASTYSNQKATDAWESPAILDRLLSELYDDKPDDVLSWLHLAIWRLRTEEVFHTKHSRIKSSRSPSKELRTPSKERKDSLGSSTKRAPIYESRSLSPLHEFPNHNGEDMLLQEESTAVIKRENSSEEFNAVIPKENSSDLARGLDVVELLLEESNGASHMMNGGHEEIPFKMIKEPSDDRAGELQEELSGSSTSEWRHAEAAFVARLSLNRNQDNDIAELGVNSMASGIGVNSMASYASDADSNFNKYFGMNRSRALELNSMHRLSHRLSSGTNNEAASVPGFICLLSPAGRCRISWDCLFVLCLLYEMWSTPFEIFFIPDDNDLPEWFRVVSIVSIIIFCIDIVLNFCTGYVSNGLIIMERRKIVVNYLRAWFWFDLLATLPALTLLTFGDAFFLARFLRGVKFYKLFKALRLLRGLRMIRNQGFVSVLMRYFEMQPLRVFILQLTQLQFILLTIAHFNGCAWALIQEESWEPKDNDEAFKKYFESLYVAVRALCMGDDLPASTQLQQVLTIISCMARICFLIVIMRWCLWRAMLIAEEASEVGLQENALAYLRHHKVSQSVQMKVFQTLKDTGVKRWVLNFERLANAAFPLNLRRTIQYELWCRRLDSIDLIRKPSCWKDQLLRDLAMVVREEVVASQVNVFTAGESSSIAFYVIQGVLGAFEPLKSKSRSDSSIGKDGRPSEIPDYTTGMWVGEKALINPELRHIHTIWCKVSSHLMGVTAETFHGLLEYHELKKPFEELLQQSLWNGMCGRCGMLGDHFSHDCKKTLPTVRRMSSIVGTQKSSTENEIMDIITGEGTARQSNIGLEAFLQRHDLEWLAPALENAGVTGIHDLTPEVIEDLKQSGQLALSEEEWAVFTGTALKDYRRMMLRATTKVLTASNADDSHYIFISHYKFESGTEAALMKEDLVKQIMEDASCPGHHLKCAVFIDTEELRDLTSLKEHVRKSHNLCLLLTPGVLTRPWCLIEIVVAVQAGVQVVPVEVQRRGVSFEYPTEGYYQRLVNGSELDEGATALIQNEDISTQDVADALRKVFMRIALPFSPHKTANVRGAELKDILKNCSHSGDWC